jgi:hypothetical protein
MAICKPHPIARNLGFTEANLLFAADQGDFYSHLLVGTADVENQTRLQA